MILIPFDSGAFPAGEKKETPSMNFNLPIRAPHTLLHQHPIPHPFPILSQVKISLVPPTAAAVAPTPATPNLQQSSSAQHDQSSRLLHILTIVTSADPSSPHPSLFSSLTPLSEPKPLCWYPSQSASQSETHYFGNEQELVWAGILWNSAIAVVNTEGSSLLRNSTSSNGADDDVPQNVDSSFVPTNAGAPNSAQAPTSENIPPLTLLTYSTSTLSHHLYLLDYIREKQENLTGDFYFRKMEAFEDFFGGERARKVVVLERASANTNTEASSDALLCFLLKSTIVAFSLNLESNGKHSYQFKIEKVYSMETVRWDSGNESILVVLQFAGEVGDMNSLQLALYDSKYCLGQFDLKHALTRYESSWMRTQLQEMEDDSSSIMQHIVGLEPSTIGEKSAEFRPMSQDASSPEAYAVALKISCQNDTKPPFTFNLNLKHLPPQTQLMQDIFQVLHKVVPLQLYANMHHDFIWMRTLFNEDVERQKRARKPSEFSFNTQKSEWEIFFILCCLNLKQDHLCFRIQEQHQNDEMRSEASRQLILHQLLGRSGLSPDCENQKVPSISPILLSSQSDLAHLKSKLHSLNGFPPDTTQQHLFTRHSTLLLLSLHLLFDSYRVYDSSTSLHNQLHLLSILTLVSRSLDMKKYVLYYACIYPQLLNTDQDTQSQQSLFDRVEPRLTDTDLSTNQSTSNFQLFSPSHLRSPPSIFQFLSDLARASRNGQRDQYFSAHNDDSSADMNTSVHTITSLFGSPNNANLYPFIRNCPPLDMSRKLCRIYWNAFMGVGTNVDERTATSQHTSAPSANDIYSPSSLDSSSQSHVHPATLLLTSPNLPVHERIVLLMNHEQIHTNELQKIGFGISGVLYDAIVACKKSPKSYWPSSVYALIGRKDILQLISPHGLNPQNAPSMANEAFIDTEAWSHYDFSDDNIEKYHDDLEQQKYLQRFLHYSNSSSSSSESQERGIGYHVFQDKRLDQVWAMLSSSCALRQGVNMCCSKPVSILLANNNGSGSGSHAASSDNEQHQQVQNQLKQQLVIQILSRSIARGLLTFSTRTINTTENIPIPPIVLKASLKRSRVNVDLSDQLPELMMNAGSATGEPQSSTATTTDPLMWPSFHNGAAQAFSIVGANTDDTHHQHITREWIVFHSPRKPTSENAGMLLALGVQGHLNALDLTDIYHCLRAQHELTSIAVLIGLSASKISSQDAGTTRTLSMHIPSLTSNSDIEIPANVQAASIMGLGLLYSGSSHRFISEVLFNELVRPPSDSSQNREGYALAAGFALGLCALSQGSDRGPPIHLAGMNIDEKLYQYMIGGTRPEYRQKSSSSMKQAARIEASSASQCTKIQESPQLINVDVTGAGACVALILMYLQSHNRSIMQKLKVPDTRYLLEYLRPNMVLLRVAGKNLVGWDWIEPSEEWIQDNIPEACRKESIMNPSISMEGQNQNEDWLRSVYSYAIAGCCFALGIRFAGTGREDIYQLVVNQIHKLESNRNPSEKPLIHHCVLVCIISLACIMSGRGNVDLVNIVLSKRKQLAGQYDAQMTLNMALGINFLGGGRCSFGTTPLAAASLLIALYPRFPSHFNDNQFHLQAFRHLYALAAVPRLLEARDVDTGKVCHVPISLTLKSGQVMQLILPSIIPEKDDIESISISTSAYYNMKIDSNMMERALDELVLWVRHRTSYLPQRHKPDQEFQGAPLSSGSSLNQSANAMNISAMSTTSDLQTSLLRVEQSHNERNIAARSPYESVEILSSEFLSTKPSMLRAVASLSTPSELLWHSLAEDNMIGVYIHEYVKSAMHSLSQGEPNDHLTDQLWNLNMLIEHKLFDGLTSHDSPTSGALLIMNTSSMSVAGDFGHTTHVSKYWLDKQDTLMDKLEKYFEQILEFISCESIQERLRFMVSHQHVCPVIKFLNIYDLKMNDIAGSDALHLKQLYPEMPWALIQFIMEQRDGGGMMQYGGAPQMDDSGDVIMA